MIPSLPPVEGIWISRFDPLPKKFTQQQTNIHDSRFFTFYYRSFGGRLPAAKRLDGRGQKTLPGYLRCTCTFLSASLSVPGTALVADIPDRIAALDSGQKRLCTEMDENGRPAEIFPAAPCPLEHHCCGQHTSSFVGDVGGAEFFGWFFSIKVQGDEAD